MHPFIFFFADKATTDNVVLFEKLSSNAVTPTKGTEGSAGFDLFAAHDREIKPFDNAVIMTDISIKMPKGVYGRIASRSGLALLYKLSVDGGVIGNFNKIN